MKVVWTPLAVDRVATIAQFIAQDNPPAAQQWVVRIFAAAKQVARFPKSGRIVPEVGRTAIREIVWRNYRIVYRLEQAHVAILTVQNTKQLLPTYDLAADARH